MAIEQPDKKSGKQLGITPREILFKYIRYLPWLIASVIVMLVLAKVRLRYSTPVYSMYGKLLVKPGAGSSGGEKFDDIFMTQGGTIKLNDEIEIIKSRTTASRVIRALGLQTSIFNQGKIRSTIVHQQEAPFAIDFLNIADSTAYFSVTIKLQEDGSYTLNEEKEKHYFSETLQAPPFTYRLIKLSRDWKTFASPEFQVTWQPIQSMSAGLAASINVSPSSDFASVLVLSYAMENTRLGVEIVDRYMYEYQLGSMEDKKLAAANTLNFIDDQLDTVKVDLSGVEGRLQSYREVNRVISPEDQAQFYFGQISEVEKAIREQGLRIKVVEFLYNYLSDQRNSYRIVPSMLSIEEPVLLQQITEFNRLQLERETAIKSVPGNNPIIVNIDISIEKLRRDMIENLKNVKQTNEILYNDQVKKSVEQNKQFGSIPSKQRQLLEVTRQQGILQELYSFLLQKKLETSIASASTISNIKVLEPAMVSGIVSPDSRSLYIMAVLLGLAVPVGVVFLKEVLNDKVLSKNDIQLVTDAPILGEIGHADNPKTLLVTKNNRKFLAEQFRIIRSNLQYILPKSDKHVIMITSSFSGEGKSFASTNLGAVVALSGKKTVILEFDIRKPKIMKGLGMTERKGLTNYIVGNVELDSIISQVPDIENLYVIACGPVPPNPAELLLDVKVTQLFEKLKDRFDIVIVDTAPIGLVSDGITLGNHADACVYIVRHNYTLKKQIQLIDEVYRQKKLPHLSIIINDIEVKGGYGGYYGYGQYGGYGYGYHSNYYDAPYNRSFFQKLFGIRKSSKPERKK